MQKSEIKEQRSSAKSRSNTPQKNSTLKIIKSPIRVIKKENSIDFNSQNNIQSLRREEKDDELIKFNVNVNSNCNINIRKNKYENENSIKNLLIKKKNNNINNIQNNLNIHPSEIINQNQNYPEMIIDKNFEEIDKRNIGKFTYIASNNFTNEIESIDINVNNNSINHNKYDINLDLKTSKKSVFEMHSKSENAKDLKIRSIIKIIPPNDLDDLNNKLNHDITKNEDLLLKYEDNNSNLDDLHYVKISNAKKKKEWRSWSLSEKELFYEAIANGANYTSLQKLFKNMNDKIGTKSTEKIRDYYYRALKNVNKLLKSVGDNGINRKNRDEVLLALNCYGKMITSSNPKTSNKLDVMKKLNKHPRLFKKTALTLKKLITSKVKSMRVKKIGNSLVNKNNKMKNCSKNAQTKKEVRNSINSNYLNSGSTIMKIIDPDINRKVAYNRSIKHVIEILTNKWKNVIKSNNTYILSLFPISELWISNQSIIFNLEDEKYYDIGDLYIGYGNPQTNILYLQYKWTDALEKKSNMIKNNDTDNENSEVLYNNLNKKINKNTVPLNASNNDRNTEKLLNNSTILISEIKENNEKRGFFSITEGNSDFLSEMQSKSINKNKLADLARGLKIEDIFNENDLKMKMFLENQKTIKKNRRIQNNKILKVNDFRVKSKKRKKENSYEESENSYEGKEKSFTPLELEYDDFDPLEFLGVYNNDIKKIDDINNISENESDFEKRFFDNENTENIHEIDNFNTKSNLDTLKNPKFMSLYNPEKNKNLNEDFTYNASYEKKGNNLIPNYRKRNIENVKIKSKKKLIKLGKNKNKMNSFIYQKDENSKLTLNDDKFSLKGNGLNSSSYINDLNNTEKKEIDLVRSSNNNLLNEENRTFDRVEFFKKLRSNSIKDNLSIKNNDDSKKPTDEANAIFNMQNSKNSSNFINLNEQVNSKVINFSEMGSKLKSNLSLTFNPNNSNKSATNNSINNLNTNLLINNFGNMNNITTNIFSIGNPYTNESNNNKSEHNKQHIQFDNEKSDDNNKFSLKKNLIDLNSENLKNTKNEKSLICGYTNDLINGSYYNLGLNSNSSKNSRNSECKNKEVNKFPTEINYEKRLGFQKLSIDELISKEKLINEDVDKAQINSDLSKNGELKKNNFNMNLKLENYNHNNIDSSKKETQNHITPSVSLLKNKNHNSNNTPKKVKRIPFVRITPERLNKEKSNIPKSHISIPKNFLNLPSSPTKIIIKEEKIEEHSQKDEIFDKNKTRFVEGYKNPTDKQNSFEKSNKKYNTLLGKINFEKSLNKVVVENAENNLNSISKNLEKSFQKQTIENNISKEINDISCIQNELNHSTKDKSNNYKDASYTPIKNQTNNHTSNTFVNNCLDRKEENPNLQNNHPYLLNEVSNFLPLGGNFTNLFCENENSMRVFQNHNFNSNIFNTDNLFYSNNFNSLFIKNNNNEDSIMNRKGFNMNADKMKSNLYPNSFYNNNSVNFIDKEKYYPKFNIPEHTNLKIKTIPINSENDKNDSDKIIDENSILINPIKGENYKNSNNNIQFTKKKTKRNKDSESKNFDQSPNNKTVLNGNSNCKNKDDLLDLESTKDKNKSNSSNNKKLLSGKNSSGLERAKNKTFKRTEPIKLEELLNETEKNKSYSISKNLNKTCNTHINLDDIEKINYPNYNTNLNFSNNNKTDSIYHYNLNDSNIGNFSQNQKTKSSKNFINNPNLENGICNNQNKKSWIINQNNYFNNYNSTTNPRFVNSFSNIDIPDPTGFIGKTKKNSSNSNVGFTNQNFWQINQMANTGFINPQLLHMQKIPMMCIPSNYYFGEYDVINKCDYSPNFGVFPSNTLIPGPMIISNNQMENNSLYEKFNIKQKANYIENTLKFGNENAKKNVHFYQEGYNVNNSNISQTNKNNDKKIKTRGKNGK